MKYNFFEYEDNFAKYKDIASIKLYGSVVTSEPLVSVVIPTYKRPHLLKEAVISVLSQRGFSDVEVVVVDNDASGEHTEEILEYLREINDSRVSYYRNQQNIGPFGNWNRGIELANGKWMTILGDDDILFDNYLSIMMDTLRDNPTLSRVECKYVPFTNIECIKLPFVKKLKQRLINKLFGRYKSVNYEMYLLGCFTGPHGQIFRREFAYQLGGFNSIFYPICDYVFNAYYLYKYPNAIQLNEYLCGYRILCNATAKPIIQVGLVKWDRRFTQFLLKYTNNFIWHIYAVLENERKYRLLKMPKGYMRTITTKSLLVLTKFTLLFVNTPRL